MRLLKTCVAVCNPKRNASYIHDLIYDLKKRFCAGMLSSISSMSLFTLV